MARGMKGIILIPEAPTQPITSALSNLEPKVNKVVEQTAHPTMGFEDLSLHPITKH